MGAPRLDASDPGDRDTFHKELDWGDLRGCAGILPGRGMKEGKGVAGLGSSLDKGQRVRRWEKGRGWEDMRLSLCRGL